MARQGPKPGESNPATATAKCPTLPESATRIKRSSEPRPTPGKDPGAVRRPIRPLGTKLSLATCPLHPSRKAQRRFSPPMVRVAFATPFDKVGRFEKHRRSHSPFSRTRRDPPCLGRSPGRQSEPKKPRLPAGFARTRGPRPKKGVGFRVPSQEATTKPSLGTGGFPKLGHRDPWEGPPRPFVLQRPTPALSVEEFRHESFTREHSRHHHPPCTASHPSTAPWGSPSGHGLPPGPSHAREARGSSRSASLRTRPQAQSPQSPVIPPGSSQVGDFCVVSGSVSQNEFLARELSHHHPPCTDSHPCPATKGSTHGHVKPPGPSHAKEVGFVSENVSLNTRLQVEGVLSASLNFTPDGTGNPHPLSPPRRNRPRAALGDPRGSHPRWSRSPLSQACPPATQRKTSDWFPLRCFPLGSGVPLHHRCLGSPRTELGSGATRGETQELGTWDPLFHREFARNPQVNREFVLPREDGSASESQARDSQPFRDPGLAFRGALSPWRTTFRADEGNVFRFVPPQSPLPRARGPCHPAEPLLAVEHCRPGDPPPPQPQSPREPGKARRELLQSLDTFPPFLFLGCSSALGG